MGFGQHSSATAPPICARAGRDIGKSARRRHGNQFVPPRRRPGQPRSSALSRPRWCSMRTRMRKSVDLHAVGVASAGGSARSEGSRRDPPTSWSPSGSSVRAAQERQRETALQPASRFVAKIGSPVPSGRAGATSRGRRVSRASYGAAIRSNRRMRSSRRARRRALDGRQCLAALGSFGSARRASRRGLSRNRRDRLARCRHPSERRASRGGREDGGRSTWRQGHSSTPRQKLSTARRVSGIRAPSQ